MQTALLLNKTSFIHERITKTALISSNCRWNKAGVCISDCYLDFYYSEWRPRSEWPKTDISRGPSELNQCQQTCPETSPWMEGRENTHRHPVLGVTAQATEPSPWSIQPIKCKAPSISASTGVYSRKHSFLNSTRSALISSPLSAKVPCRHSHWTAQFTRIPLHLKNMLTFMKDNTYGNINMKN